MDSFDWVYIENWEKKKFNSRQDLLSKSKDEIQENQNIQNKLNEMMKISLPLMDIVYCWFWLNDD